MITMTREASPQMGNRVGARAVCAAAAAVLCAALAAGPSVRLEAQATEDPQKGASLMAEARKAIGGEDKLRAVKTLQSKGVFKRTQATTRRKATSRSSSSCPTSTGATS
jgi:hypothetical protein